MDEEVGAAGRQQVTARSIRLSALDSCLVRVAENAFDFGRPAIQMTPGAGAGAS